MLLLHSPAHVLTETGESKTVYLERVRRRHGERPRNIQGQTETESEKETDKQTGKEIEREGQRVRERGQRVCMWV